jgi:hypothetical protein
MTQGSSAAAALFFEPASVTDVACHRIRDDEEDATEEDKDSIHLFMIIVGITHQDSAGKNDDGCCDLVYQVSPLEVWMC